MIGARCSSSRSLAAGPALVATILLVAVNLRGAVVAVAPLLVSIRNDTGISSAAAGGLSAIPVVCFGVFAVPALRVARRVGLERTLTAAMAFLAAGVLLRSVAPIAALFAGTAMLGAGIAAANVLLPALIKRGYPLRTGAMTALYVAALSVGATLASGGTIPLEQQTGLGWRGVLSLWAAPALLAAIWIGYARRRSDAAPPALTELRPISGLHRESLAWHVTAYMGLQSFSFYAITSWLPTLLSERGLSASRSGFLLALASISSVPAALAAPVIASRMTTQFKPMLAISGMWLVSLVGLLLLPVGTTPPLMVLLGLSQGASLGVALTLILLRAPDSEHAAQLSTMAQGLGYLLAGTGPVVVGVLHGATGGWSLPLLVLSAVIVVQCAAGLAASRDLQVGAQHAAGR